MAFLGRSQHIDASIIPSATLVPVALWMKRVFAFVLIGLSLYGTYVQALPYGDGEGQAFLIALVFQAVVSLAQFAFRRQWQSIWYAGALLLSVVPSILTFAPLITPSMEKSGLPGWAALLVVSLVALAGDIIPEQILVKK